MNKCSTLIFMKNKLLFTALWLLIIMGALAIWIISSKHSPNSDIQHYPNSNVHYTLNGNENFTAWTITITNCDGTNENICTTITILDRNLWATEAGTWLCIDPEWNWKCFWDWKDDPTYGYHFQWWNNHWFKPCIDIKNCKTFPWWESIWESQITTLDNTYGPYYRNPVFIEWWSNQWWYNDNSKVDLWWWSEDDYTDANNWNWEVTNAEQRQWPCPEWFHVPSYGELNKVIRMIGDDSETVRNELLIPFAGFRFYYDSSVDFLGEYSLLWSSSPDSISWPASISLRLKVDGYTDIYDYYRAGAWSIRCFYNFYKPYDKTDIQK